MKSLVIFAAGHGSRLNSKGPKALFQVKGEQKILDVILDNVEESFDHIYIVIQPKFLDEFTVHTKERLKITYLLQDKPRGTAIALKDVLPLIPEGIVATLWGDQVGISKKLVEMTLTKFEVDKEQGILLPLCWRTNPYVTFDILNGFVTDFHESPKLSSGGYQDSGFAVSTLTTLQILFRNFQTTLEKLEMSGVELNLMTAFVSGRNGVQCIPMIHNELTTTLGINSIADLHLYLGAVHVEE